MDRNSERPGARAKKPPVALRKERVDRNRQPLTGWPILWSRSPQGERGKKSSHMWQVVVPFPVALRKESVDRNVSPAREVPLSPSRSPQGERG